MARLCKVLYVDQPVVIEKILGHLGLWPTQALSPPSFAAAE
jgi:hypothetical protein